MNIAPYVTQLGTVGALSVAEAASPGVTALATDTGTALYAALSPLVGGRVYPLHVEPTTDWPHITYGLVASQPNVMDGYHLSTDDRYIVRITTETDTDLVNTIAAVESACEGASGAIEITDTSWDFIEDPRRYQALIELTYTIPASTGAALPAGLVYPLDVTADRNETDRCIRQREWNRFGILIMTADGNIPALRDAIKNAMIGYQVDGTYWPVQYVSGRPVESSGGLEMWAEVYQDSHYLEEV